MRNCYSANMEEKLKYHSVALEDKARIERYLNYWNIQAAGLQFSTLFLWGSENRIRIAEEDDALYILVAQENGDMSVGPLTLRPENYARILQRTEEDCRLCGREARFCVIPEQTLPYFRDNGYAVCENRNDAEYVYSIQELIELKGKAFHGKRNHINAYTAEHSFEYVNIDASMKDECMRVLAQWSEGKDGEAGLLDEKKAILLALSNMDKLELVAGGIKENGVLQAFSIGGRINRDTALIHFEKAIDVRGLFPLINREFLFHAFADARYANREEDMGDPGLRKAKESYQPVRMEKIYCAKRSK